MDKNITRENCLAYREYKVIIGDTTLKFDLLFAVPKKHATDDDYVGGYTIVGPGENVRQTLEFSGIDSLQALLLNLHSGFDLIDIHIKNLIKEHGLDK